MNSLILATAPACGIVNSITKGMVLDQKIKQLQTGKKNTANSKNKWKSSVWWGPKNAKKYPKTTKQTKLKILQK